MQRGCLSVENANGSPLEASLKKYQNPLRGHLPAGPSIAPPPPPPPPEPKNTSIWTYNSHCEGPAYSSCSTCGGCRTCCFCLGTPLGLIERVYGVSWSRTTHEELCFVWGGGRGGHGRMVCWVLPRHRLNGKEEIYSGRPPSTPRIKSLRRTRFCRQNEQRRSHSLVAEDRKTASFEAPIPCTHLVSAFEKRKKRDRGLLYISGFSIGKLK